MNPNKIGVVLVFSLSFVLTSCWPTDSDSNSSKCNFAETDSEWVYQTSSNYEDGSTESDVKVTVTDTGAVEHYKSVKRGSSLHTGCDNLMPSVMGTEENPQTSTSDKFTGTFYCKNSEYHSEFDYYINFKDESSQYKSRKQLFDKHMESCKAAGKYYGGGPFF
ncbi:MAG: hypothetical protein J6W51_08530 [Fibrobacter sp.]|nr:hypothetical protein [Fibrobacter sp.]